MSSDTPTLPDRKACARCGKEFTAGETTCTDDGTQLTPIRKEGLSGTVAGKYEILSSLGDGGWGTVYKAQYIDIEHCSGLDKWFLIFPSESASIVSLTFDFRMTSRTTLAGIATTLNLPTSYIWDGEGLGPFFAMPHTNFVLVRAEINASG